MIWLHGPRVINFVKNISRTHYSVRLFASCTTIISIPSLILWASKQNFCHLERSYLLLLCGIGYNVVQWSRCEIKRDLLYFFNICNNIITQHINIVYNTTYKCQSYGTLSLMLLCCDL